MKALMPGSYDPCTVGHLAVIEAAASLFEEITVAVFINPQKEGLFSYRERVEFLRLATAHLPGVTVTFSDGMVADFARDGGYDRIVKGVRNERDRLYEAEMAVYNFEHSGVITELIPADSGMQEVSSTAVREALAGGEELCGLVPEAARAAILAAYRKGADAPKGAAMKDYTSELREDFLSREEIFLGKIVHLVKDTVTLPNGRTATREMMLHPGAVAILPLFPDGSVLMEYQYRYPLGRVVYEIPAGKLDSREEDPREAALRELREETGYTAGRLTSLGYYIPSPAVLSERIELFLAEELTLGDTELDEDEFLMTERRPLAELCEMVMRGEIEDGKTQTALLKTLLLKKESI